MMMMMMMMIRGHMIQDSNVKAHITTTTTACSREKQRI